MSLPRRSDDSAAEHTERSDDDHADIEINGELQAHDFRAMPSPSREKNRWQEYEKDRRQDQIERVVKADDWPCETDADQDRGLSGCKKQRIAQPVTEEIVEKGCIERESRHGPERILLETGHHFLRKHTNEHGAVATCESIIADDAGRNR